MSIPKNTVAPNLPLALNEYDRLAQQTLTNVLRLYFNQLDAFDSIAAEQISANQANIWLGNGGGMFSG
jgi:hypothetical protein